MGEQRREKESADQKTGTFELKDAVTLYINQRSAANQLWATYVIATFAAAGFALTAEAAILKFLLPAVLVGFLAFTIGHWHLVKASIIQVNAVASDIKEALGVEPKHRYEKTLAEIAKPAMRIDRSFLCHVIIDGCVIVACCARMGLLWAEDARAVLSWL